MLFRIGSFEVTSFGAMVAAGALVGLWLFRRELRRRGLPEAAADAAIVGLIGGMIGAKLLYVFEHLGEEAVTSLLFARGGMSWYGGLIGGVGSGLVSLLRGGWPLVPVLAAATPALAIGHLLGRIGCFLVGDDYGRPTDLPWGVAFPEGLPPTPVPVHPTQLYEAAFLGVLTWLLLRWRRQGVSDRVVLGRYLILAGAVRFAIEFIRVNVRVLGGLSVAHLVSLALIAAGLIVMLRSRQSPSLTNH
ncbi:MAG: prolipoprotein diacylglyceryl transferase family protein [Vicinamibacterales bacterium]